MAAPQSLRHTTRSPKSVLYRYAGVGTQFAATLGVFGFVGYWLDEKCGSQPWFLLVGIFLGFGLGLYSMVSKLSPGLLSDGEADDEDSPTSTPRQR